MGRRLDSGQQQKDQAVKMKRKASISDDGKYRWMLIRRWDYNKPTLTWIMLNPSLADGEYDTPTIERVIRISKVLGYGGCTVVNLYSWRSPRASDLRRHSQTKLIGPLGNSVLARVGHLCRKHNRPVMVAWGSQALASRVEFVINTYFHDVELMCLGINKSGHPVHPSSQGLSLNFIRELVSPWSLEDLSSNDG